MVYSAVSLGVGAVFAATLCLGATAMADGAAQAAERDALMALYNATNGPGWGKNDGWGTNSDHCTWYGVTCDATGRVVQLSQYDNLLEGTVPADVWEGLNVLTELTYFALSTNFLYGQPGLTSFGSTFTKNEYFDLNYNHLDGPVPAVGAQTKLTHLILANNNFNGSVAEVLAPLSQLNYLDIHSNWLSGSIPDSLCREANLTYCSLVSPKHKQNVFSDVPGCITSSTKCILG